VSPRKNDGTEADERRRYLDPTRFIDSDHAGVTIDAATAAAKGRPYQRQFDGEHDIPTDAHQRVAADDALWSGPRPAAGGP